MTAAPRSADWIAAAADAAEAWAARHKGPDDTLVCASGISPSGPIHLGNLREVLTTHFVAEELRARGRKVDHLHSWDDFDRLRKVPVGIPEHFAEFIGQPLSRVPDPQGELPSWADRYIQQFRAAVEPLGVQARWVRQSEMYGTRNAYADAVCDCLARRHEIFEVLARYQTEKLQELSLDERREAFWPYRVYDPVTGRDDAELLSYDPDTCVLTWRSRGDGSVAQADLRTESPGKLVWKVDWPMRWAFEKVDFEPGGADHSSPGSSYTVGSELVRTFFAWDPPEYVPYAFVGFGGQSKMSSSRGVSATPDFALQFVEPALLRWLYLRRRPDAEFAIDFGEQLWRAYDEWDALARKVEAGEVDGVEAAMYHRALRTSAGEVAAPRRRVAFRTLWTALDSTQGDRTQTLRIAAAHLDDDPDPATLEAELEPRLTCAAGWVEHVLPEEDRVRPREAFDRAAWDALDPREQQAIARLLAEASSPWTLHKLESLLYGVPKLMAGLPLDADPPAEVKKAQRELFKALYRLLLDAER
ncbi:MAG: lysine--tRNA ligase, partial [Alphaproteobacteria bacterium]|nr:lysine--tRNA ligase [Alphaproteobacteria bacterium]